MKKSHSPSPYSFLRTERKILGVTSPRAQWTTWGLQFCLFILLDDIIVAGLTYHFVELKKSNRYIYHDIYPYYLTSP